MWRRFWEQKPFRFVGFFVGGIILLVLVLVASFRSVLWVSVFTLFTSLFTLYRRHRK